MHALCLHIRRLKTWIHAKLVLRRLVGLVVLIISSLFSTQRVPAQMLTGSYTGNGLDNRPIGQLGFQPSFVIIKSASTNIAVGRTSSMSGDLSKPLSGGTALAANLIQSLDSGGFTIGNDSKVNANTVTYYWAAFKTAAGYVSVGSYTGNGTDGHQITGIGFQPCYLIVMSASGYRAMHTSSNTLGISRELDGTNANFSDGVETLDSDGFTVGTNNEVNRNNISYHYVAWKQSDTKVKVGSYTGNNTDGTSITVGTNFYPEYVIVQVKGTNVYGAVQHPGSLGYSTDLTLPFSTDDPFLDGIQALGTSSFQVGTHNFVNGSLKTYFWVAFARQAPTAVEMISFTASQYERRVLLQWQTGFEVDNLGFHVYRETNGERVRITPQLIAGSALLAGARTPLTAGRSYAWADFVGEAAGAVQYWLEDIDLNGRRTLHGPVAPVLSSEPLPEQEVSALLSQIGRPGANNPDALNQIQKLRAQLRSTPARGLGRPAKTVALVPTRLALPQDQSAPGRLEVQWALASQRAAKLAVGQEGWYRVSFQTLVAAGLDPQADPRCLQLYLNGQEQPLLVMGNRLGRRDPTGDIEFYGVGQDTPWTDTNIYWLVAGTQPGKRVAVVPGTGRGAAPPASFPFTVEWKDRTIFFGGLRNGQASNFFGPIVTATPVDQVLAVSHLAPPPTGDATVEVALQGVTDAPHRVAVQINAVEVGIVEFDGQSHGAASIAVPQSILMEGDNLVTLTARGGESDVSLIDSVQLTYWHSYTADQDALRCTAPAGSQPTIGGFTNSPIRVIDITDPAAPIEIKGTVRSQGGEFAVTVKVPGIGKRTLLAFAPAGLKAPVETVGNVPSAWHQGEGADIAIISHGSFIESLAPLHDLRKAQGRSVALIDVQELYDEFNFGSKSSSALKDFLDLTQSAWQTPPRFVLLVGDASFDPRNYLGLGSFDFVPTATVDTAYLETVSDDWFADFNGDDLPEMAVGRLPVRTAAEAATVVSKIVGYEQSAGGDWARKALFVADKKDVFDFEKASADAAVLLPGTMTVDGVFLGGLDIVTARRLLTSQLNSGQLLVNYLGHGSMDFWAKQVLFTSDNAYTLTNTPRLPFVVSMTCLTGMFDDLYAVPLAEALLKAPNGGAVAVWASSGLTEPGAQAIMDQELIRLLFNGPSLTIGEAAARAKAAVHDQDVRRTWILFGDPAMRLR